MASEDIETPVGKTKCFIWTDEETALLLQVVADYKIKKQMPRTGKQFAPNMKKFANDLLQPIQVKKTLKRSQDPLVKSQQIE